MDLEPLWEINEPWLSFEALDSRAGICLGFINADQQFEIFSCGLFLDEPQSIHRFAHSKFPDCRSPTTQIPAALDNQQ
jgi:hypothetical protein